MDRVMLSVCQSFGGSIFGEKVEGASIMLKG